MSDAMARKRPATHLHAMSIGWLHKFATSPTVLGSVVLFVCGKYHCEGPAGVLSGSPLQQIPLPRFVTRIASRAQWSHAVCEPWASVKNPSPAARLGRIALRRD